MFWPVLILATIVIFGFICLRRLSSEEWGRVVRFGKVKSKGKRPGLVFIYPFIERLERVSISPFSVSLPPQSAITSDEIPIQVQASLDAMVMNPDLAVTRVKDWRIFLMSQLQDLIKERLEQFDSDTIGTNFVNFANSIRTELKAKSESIGVELIRLDISNLSPPTVRE